MRIYLTTPIIFIQYDLVCGRGGWPWLLDDADKVNRTWLLKVGDRRNEFLVLEKRERNMKKPQSFKEKSGRKNILTDLESSFESAAESQHAQKMGEVI